MDGGLEKRGHGVKIEGHWLGVCFFEDNIVLVADSGEKLQRMLDVVASYGENGRLSLTTTNAECW